MQGKFAQVEWTRETSLTVNQYKNHFVIEFVVVLFIAVVIVLTYRMILSLSMFK
jgi:hypothetical protein